MHELTAERGARDDRGFTLIELLVTIVILGVIMVPLTNFIIGYLRDTAGTDARLNESSDAQTAATYFSKDVASLGVRASTAPTAALVQSVETNAPYGGGLYPCGSAGTPNAVVRFAWDDVSVGGTVTLGYNRVAYVVETASGETQLHRIACAGSASAISDAVLARDLVSATVVCNPAACAGAGNSVPNQVTLTLDIHDPSSTASSHYIVTLSGQRRAT